MSHKDKLVYINAIKDRYINSNKQEKKLILDEFCKVCNYNRKYAIRVLNKPTNKWQYKKKRGPKFKYNDKDFIKALKTIWEAADYICSKRLHSAIPLWLPFLESQQIRITDEISEKLLSISPPTIDRILKSSRIKSKKGLSGTKPGSLLKNKIPIRTDNWDIIKPGFIEADTVAHCGNNLAGDFIWSITMTDIFTGWTENRAVWNKGALGVNKQVKDVENKLPFELLGFDCDNGSEFLNHHLLRYFSDRKNKVSFTRSRPYKKNDNAHVEQKNWTQVRHLFGYDRLDIQSLVEPINDLYSNEWSLYNNFFRPSQKLIKKTKINSKYIRKYDKPKTPYKRLLESGSLSEEKVKKLNDLYKTLNPFELKNKIEYKLKQIFKNVMVTSNVRHRI
jgi:hypothetical protein